MNDMNDVLSPVSPLLKPHMKDVYDELVDLCSKSEVFYFVDQEIGSSKFRIFNYRLASYMDWQMHPWAMELRGLMFELHPHGGYYRLACRPMKKFFNLNENPYTMDLDLSVKGRAYDKLDGSLISSYMYSDEGCADLGLKSKASLHSQQARDAFAWLMKMENVQYFLAIQDITSEGYTIDFEWTAPQNRVVIGYTQPALTILGIRKNDTGEYVTVPRNLYHNHVPSKFVDNVGEFVSRIADMKGIEGYVLLTETGHRFKVKTAQYLALHKLKDDVSSPKKVAEVIMNEAIDDFKAAFCEDKLLIQMIERMEDEVKTVFNHLGKKIDDWFETNKELDRKSYAIKGQSEMKEVFGLVMSKYLGKKVSLKDFIIKNFDDFFPNTDWYAPQGVSQ